MLWRHVCVLNYLYSPIEIVIMRRTFEFVTSIIRYIASPSLLLRAIKEVPHGGWLRWLGWHLPVVGYLYQVMVSAGGWSLAWLRLSSNRSSIYSPIIFSNDWSFIHSSSWKLETSLYIVYRHIEKLWYQLNFGFKPFPELFIFTLFL